MNMESPASLSLDSPDFMDLKHGQYLLFNLTKMAFLFSMFIRLMEK
jgi:hypothetical protein